MDLLKIKKMIHQAIENEKNTQTMAQTVIKVAKKHGKTLSSEDANEVINFIKAYVKHVPMLLEEAMRYAHRFGIEKEMGQMLKELDDYWALEQDEIPDNLGLYGLMDDAYASMYLLQTLSRFCDNYYGRKLMKNEFTRTNRVIRTLLGARVANRLEKNIIKGVKTNMKDHKKEEIYQNIFKSGFAFEKLYDPYWDGISLERNGEHQSDTLGVG